MCTVASGCGPSKPKPAPPQKPVGPVSTECHDPGRAHMVFTIQVDGEDVGREVRSRRFSDGPMGPEMFILSHISRRMKSGAYDFDRHTVRAELTRAGDGILLRGSYVSLEHFYAKVTLVGFNGTGWDRVIESRESVSDPIRQTPSPVALTGDEIIGFRLVDHMAAIAAGEVQHPEPVLYYDPSIHTPVELSFNGPERGSITRGDRHIPGAWVSAVRESAERVRIFFAEDGTPIEEHYPALHQVRRLVEGPVTFPEETSDPLVGLFSRTYLGMPNAATWARFELTTAEQYENDALAFLGEPSNQKLTNVEPNLLRLEVEAGAPDGNAPPVDADLGTSLYIKPKSPEIRAALKLLRSGGKNGKLSSSRAENAVPVLARAALIQNPARFWKDPDKVTELIMRYVYAMLPDKRHTFSMADAVATLDKGSGDCTEHSVLFASLMRAHGIPTRLVAGLYLSHGGLWVYHMWAEYWDGALWQPVDPGNSIFRPGALYVALGKGASQFSDLRSEVASFLDRAFSGVSFDLVKATDRGEPMLLARPRSAVGNGADTTVFNAAMAYSRGDPKGALKILDEGIGSSPPPVRLSLFRAQVLVSLERWDEAISLIASLREKTSSPTNKYTLDNLEFLCFLGMDKLDSAAKTLEHMGAYLPEESPDYVSHRARYMLASGDEAGAVRLLTRGLETAPDDTTLLIAFATLVSNMGGSDAGADLLEVALEHGESALAEGLYSDIDALTATARLYALLKRWKDASTLVDHGLVLTPFDRELAALRELIDANRCGE